MVKLPVVVLDSGDLGLLAFFSDVKPSSLLSFL